MSKICNACGSPAYERKTPEDRRRELLDAAVELARESGYLKMTHSHVAGRVEVSPSLVRKYYTNKAELHDAVMSEAVRLSIPEIVLQGLAAMDPIAHSAPAGLKAAAWESCA